MYEKWWSMLRIRKLMIWKELIPCEYEKILEFV